MMKRQRGSTLIGIVIGLVLGLAAALAVAVYVTKVPMPFSNKTQTRTPEQDAAESRKNQNWDPNAPLYGKNPAAASPATAAASGVAPPASAPASSAPAPAVPAASAAAAAPAPAAAAAASPAPSPAQPPTARSDPLGDLAAIRSGAAVDPFMYFVQAGAFRVAEDAEAQRAKLSLMGLDARVSEREQSGRVVYRVRIGPVDRKDDADRIKGRLEAGGVEAALVRVQR